jgi:hypothetical protein
METVEKMTTALATPPDVAGDHVGDIKPRQAGASVVAATTPRAAAATGDWDGLLQTGLAWIEQLAALARASSGNGRAEGLRFVHRDPQTGEDYLRIPVPSSDVLDRALQTIGTLLDRFRR